MRFFLCRVPRVVLPLMAMFAALGFAGFPVLSQIRTTATPGIVAQEAEDADVWALRARQFEKAGSVFEALDAYDRAVSMEPSRLDIRLEYAEILKTASFWLRSADQFRTILATQPDNFQALIGYGELLNAEYQFPLAMAQFKKALAGAPTPMQHERVQIGLGSAQFGREDYAAAVLTFDAALKEHPGSLNATAFLAIAKQKLGQIEEALRLWNGLLEKHPESTPGRIRRTELDTIIAEIAMARQSVAADPANAAAWESLGKLLRRQPDLRGAGEAFSAAAKLAPDVRSYRFWLGAVERDRGRWAEAAAAFASVGNDPTWGSFARYNLAWCLKRQGIREGELKAWQAAVIANPRDLYAYERWADVLRTVHGLDLEKVRMLQSIKEDSTSASGSVLQRVQLSILHKTAQEMGPALDAAIAALRLDPVDPHAQRLLRELLRTSGTTVEQEITKLDSLLSAQGSAPGEVSDTRTKGAILLAVGREQEAEGEFQRVLEAAPADARAMVGLAFCLRIRGAVAEAIPLLRSAILLAPSYLPAHLNLGVALLDAHKSNDAIEVAKTAVQLMPGDPLGYSILGSALRLRGELEKAARALEMAVASDPMDTMGASRFMLAKIYGAMGKNDEARAALSGDLPQEPDEIYRIAWEFVRDNYKDQRYHGQDWRAWQHRFDGTLATTSDALGAVALMLSSLDDRNTHLRSADQTARLIFTERSGDVEFGRSGAALFTSKTLETRHLEGDIGYVAITNFYDPKLTGEIKEAVESVKNDNGVILDLRGNQGGGEADVSRIVGMLVNAGTETGTIVAPEGTVKMRASTTGDQSGPIIPSDKPVVVLVDRHTASSAEILAGSLKQANRALLVGEKTYGKSGIQLPRLLPGGAIALVVVADRGDLTGAIYTGVGIKPDVSVEGASTGNRGDDDPALDKAKELLRKRKPGS